ncbi:MAG: N-acetylglucosamine-6-phosphate deacetylase [Gemmataceae bacterium]|jgi:N-acetylglucosamine-6-phosphate deacetylase|nr:N-acetylglucosamine-6-phosphate deacetylase [Gemmataceae bacterium]
MMNRFCNGSVIIRDRILPDGEVLTLDDRIVEVGPSTGSSPGITLIDLEEGYLLPGFVDLHVHGGLGADFMDGTEESFSTVLQAHSYHGTTSLTPTSTVAPANQILKFLELTKKFLNHSHNGARVLGAHLYGPYFAPEARGCHPADSLRPPSHDDYKAYLAYADAIRTATVAPELPGAQEFAQACQRAGIRLNVGHSHASFAQVETAIGWGVRHVDHLFCAMSDRARMKLQQPYPMRGGVMEATLYFDELTTEIICDGVHLAPDLIRLAYKVKGPQRLAVVSDTSRAMDMPDGLYMFGHPTSGQQIRKEGYQGLTVDRTGLASGVVGLDYAFRVFLNATRASLVDAAQVFSLTPARILGLESLIGSIEVGKKADLLVFDRDFNLKRVFINGREIARPF